MNRKTIGQCGPCPLAVSGERSIFVWQNQNVIRRASTLRKREGVSADMFASPVRLTLFLNSVSYKCFKVYSPSAINDLQQP